MWRTDDQKSASEFRPGATVQKRHPEATFDLLHTAAEARVIYLRKL